LALLSELLEVGRIVKPHGLKGQVVVELWTNRTERVAPGASLTAPAGDMRVTRSSQTAPSGGRDRWLVSFEGVDDRESAEALRGVVLRAESLDEPGSLWVHELVGRDVFEVSGELLGVVEAVEANPASDLLVLADGVLIPLTFVVETGERGLTVKLPEGLRDL
jgi:16S rRNA processing protein RimM